jgi:hypothetical protein
MGNSTVINELRRGELSERISRSPTLGVTFRSFLLNSSGGTFRMHPRLCQSDDYIIKVKENTSNYSDFVHQSRVIIRLIIN